MDAYTPAADGHNAASVIATLPTPAISTNHALPGSNGEQDMSHATNALPGDTTEVASVAPEAFTITSNQCVAAEGPSGQADADAGTASSSSSAVAPPREQLTTLDLALDFVTTNSGLNGDQIRHIRSDFSTLCKVIGKPLCALPCAPAALRPLLKAVRPARHNMARKRWSAVKSSVARVLKLTGWVDTDGSDYADLTPVWKSAIDHLPQPGQKASLTGFARFCIAGQVAPEAVSLQTILAYQQWRTDRTLILDVTHTATIIRRLWHYLQKYHPDWPQGKIPAAHDPRIIALPAASFPENFQAEVAMLIHNMGIVRPFDERCSRKYSPVTITFARNAIYRAASIIARAGAGPQAVTSLRDVLAPAGFEVVLTEHFTRVGGDDHWAPSARTLAYTLKRAAIICGAVTAVEIKKLDELISRITPASAVLSQRSHAKVAQFYDPAAVKKLMALPDLLYKEVAKLTKDVNLPSASHLHARAVQLDILLAQPLRRKNLASLEIHRHFRRDQAGRIITLLIPGEDTKSGKSIIAKIERDLAIRIDEHIKAHRPKGSENSPYLFPGGDNGHVSPSTVGRNIKALVEEGLGLDFNVHLIRHIVATFLIEDDHRNVALAQQILGHRDRKTTDRIYGQVRVVAAQNAWGIALANRDREQFDVPPPPPGRGKPRGKR